MRGRDMHPLCCISMDCPGAGTAGAGGRSPEPPSDPAAEHAGSDGNASGEVGSDSASAVAGVLYKWTNYGKGWQPRWFFLHHGILSYSKIRRRDGLPPEAVAADVRLIGDASGLLGGLRPAKKLEAVVHLKISSFRESNSDDRRFYIFSPIKTLHLRTSSKKDREAWVKALISAKNVYSLRSLSEKIPFVHNEFYFSTEKLRDRMHVEGLGEALIKDCEQIMQSEFLEFHKQLRFRYDSHLRLLGAFQPQLEEVNVEDESTTIRAGQLHLINHEFSSSGHGKYSEYSTTESSDDIEKQEYDELSDEDEPIFFDTIEGFVDSSSTHAPGIGARDHVGINCRNKNFTGNMEVVHTDIKPSEHRTFSCITRRKQLPEPIEKEKGVSLWSMIKDNVGKDLTRVCLPVYFNEPLSSLQKCFEDLEYSCLLDQAYEYGKTGNSLMRCLHVAAFAVSGYASSDGRLCKPFNPMLGETYEADYTEQGIRFFSEKVSHHPMLIACHCEGKGWKFWGDSNLRSKFWGRSIQLDPVGILTLEFDDGEIFKWSKVTTTIYNLILGKVYCDHHGTMNIQGNRQYSCKLKFKEQSLLDRSPRQVTGFVEDVMRTKVASLMGKWDDSIYYTKRDDLSNFSNNKGCDTSENASLLWKRNKPSANPTRYNLTSFAITLNELTPDLQEKLPPTDSRLRPDQRHLENGEYEKANAEKLRLERRQRMSRKLQDNGWKPRWFQKDAEDGTYRYIGGYWEARENKKWDGCPVIFGEFVDDVNGIRSE